jgi:hypothetical protein
MRDYKLCVLQYAQQAHQIMRSDAIAVVCSAKSQLRCRRFSATRGVRGVALLQHFEPDVSLSHNPASHL